MTPVPAELQSPEFRDVPRATVVTGAAGWLGQALVGQLADEPGRRLRCLVRSDDQREAVRRCAPDAEVLVGDMLDPLAVDRLFDGMEEATVFHTAAVIHPARFTREFFDNNVGGTSLVLDRARRTGAQRVVHLSSNSPFGFNRSPFDVFDTDAEYRPVGGYGRSKMEAEQRVLQMADRGELDAVIIRAPWFYGPRQPDRQTQWFATIRKGNFPLFGDGSNRRSMVYVDNLVQGLMRAERRDDASGRAFWIADAEPYPMRTILEAVKGALKRAGLAVAGRQVRLPGVMCEVALRADGVLQGFGRYSQSVHVLSEMNKTIACTIDDARKGLGYEPMVAIDEGMDRSVAWCLDQGLEL